MSDKIITFEAFAKECKHQNRENDVFAECLHDENFEENCIEGRCPLVILASLSDVKRLDPESYEDEARAFSEELSRGEDESKLLLAIKSAI